MELFNLRRVPPMTNRRRATAPSLLHSVATSVAPVESAAQVVDVAKAPRLKRPLAQAS